MSHGAVDLSLPLAQAHHGVTAPDFGQPFVTPDKLAKGHMYAFVLDANFRTNFPPLQQADLLFRYAIASHQGSWTNGNARDVGWGVGNPLVAVSVDGKQEGPLPAAASFCQVDRANVFLLTLKQAEDGDGIVIRLIETEGQEVTTAVTLPQLTVKRAFRANLAEENREELACTPHQIVVPVSPFQTVTIRVRTQ